MKVGDSIRKAIDDWQAGDLESAMLHACNAVDGTAKKLYPRVGSNARFTRLLRENYFILGPMGMPGIDIERTRFPVKVERPKADDGLPDLADVIYGIHRCAHGHGDELPNGFELIEDAGGPPGHTRVFIERGKLRLSDRTIFGLLAVAALSPANVDQRVPEGYHFTFGANTIVLPINEWWGRAHDFPAIAMTQPTPMLKLDFKEWLGAADS